MKPKKLSAISLSPCPFCGCEENDGDPDVYVAFVGRIDEHQLVDFTYHAYAVHCGNCLAEGPEQDDPDDAARWWNMRSNMEDDPIEWRDV